MAGLAWGVTLVDLSPFQADIERVRKLPVRIEVMDENGRRVENAEIFCEQVSHEFLFGNAPEYLLFAFAPQAYSRGGRFGAQPLSLERIEEYQCLYLELFNFATLPAFYWKDYEPEPGRLPLKEAAHRIAGWLQSHGVSVKGHTLVWGNPPSVGVPSWVWMKGRAGRWEEVKEALFRRIRREVQDFKGLVHLWDVVNEPIVQPWFEGLGPEYIAEAFKAVKEIDPQAVLVLNEFGMLLDGKIRKRFIERTRKLLEAGVPIDVIGVEAHLFTPEDIRKHLESLEEIRSALDELAALGKPIHITEFQIPLPAVVAAFKVPVGEAEILQAELARVFYTVFFSHPAVSAITYWNFYRAWQPGSGFLRDDFTLKPLYFVVRDLIHREWKTRVCLRTGADGVVEFRGFPGDYRVWVTGPSGKKEEFTVSVRCGTPNAFVLQIGGEWK
jgi:GH35 family endo-1,4-beta-xylanase